MSHVPLPISDQPVLKLQDVVRRIGRTTVLHGVTLQVRRGEMAAVLGPQGGGKTTLLQTISGMQSAHSGSILFKGENIGGEHASQIVAQGLSHVAHDRAVFSHLTVQDNLRMGAYTREDNDQVAHDMEAMYGYFALLRSCSDRPASGLSAYPQLMLAVACALMAAPDLLMIDAPVRALTPVQCEEFMKLLVQINRERGLAILMTEDGTGSHTLAIADYGYVLDQGRIVMEGTAAALREKIRYASAGTPSRRLHETI